jgi:hypothetical protein
MEKTVVMFVARAKQLNAVGNVEASKRYFSFYFVYIK